MKRHSSLVPLSHDHHHALVRARQLHGAAQGETAVRQAEAASFVRFFAGETVRHFREEEERLFPLLVDFAWQAEELLVQALLEHRRLRALVARLDRELATDSVAPALMRELADLLESHTRFEERRLFPLVEEVASEALLRLELAASHAADTELVRGAVPLDRET
jgi:hemerythrin-like domain-containing protein